MIDDDEIDRIENVKRIAAGRALAIMLAASMLFWFFMFAAFYTLAALII